MRTRRPSIDSHDERTLTETPVQLNRAPTTSSFIMITVQSGNVPDELQAPVHPRNVCFFVILIDNVTLVPIGNDAEHCLPQLRPFGLLAMVPGPAIVALSPNR